MASGDIVDSITGPFTGMVGGFGLLIKFIGFGAVFGAIAAGLIYWWINFKKWNLKVEFKMLRSDGRVVNAECGKGLYNVKKGYILLKRKGIKDTIEMKPADPKSYIYGDNILTVGQIGPNNWVPIAPESFMQYKDDKGKKKYFIDLKSDLTDQLSWAENFRRRSKDVYSIRNLLEKYQTPIAIGFVVLCQAISTAFIIAVIK